jgi:serine/threonine protein kinase
VAALVGLELARGLEAIHARGTVHRDLKPANVLLGRNGDVKIADFGIAIGAASDGLTRPGTTIGTPPYVAPEQILGERVDARGDLFALGVVLYELLAGAPPFREPAEGEDTLPSASSAGATRACASPRSHPLAGRWSAPLLRAKPAPGPLRPSSCAGCSSAGWMPSRPTPSSSSRAFSGARVSSSLGRATRWCSRRWRRRASACAACAASRSPPAWPALGARMSIASSRNARARAAGKGRAGAHVGE